MMQSSNERIAAITYAGALAVALVLELGGRSRAARFVGQWPTPLLVMGIYNKLVKTLGTR